MGAGVGVGTSVGTGTAVSATVSGLPGRTTVLEPLSPGSPTAGLITGLNRKPCRCRSTSDLSTSKSKLMNVVWPSASSKFPTSLIVSLGTSAVISSPSFSICTSGTERRTCVLASREFGGAENGLDALKDQQFKCNLFVDDGQPALTRYRDLDIVGRHVDGGNRWGRCIGDPLFESTGGRIRSRATPSIAVSRCMLVAVGTAAGLAVAVGALGAVAVGTGR